MNGNKTKCQWKSVTFVTYLILRYRLEFILYRLSCLFCTFFHYLPQWLFCNLSQSLIRKNRILWCLLSAVDHMLSLKNCCKNCIPVFLESFFYFYSVTVSFGISGNIESFWSRKFLEFLREIFCAFFKGEKPKLSYQIRYKTDVFQWPTFKWLFQDPHATI